MQSAKEKIKKIYLEYRKLFPEQYQTFTKGIKVLRENQANKFSEIKGTDFIVRQLYSIPDELDIMICQTLDTEEFNWYEQKEGSRWFAKTFNEFSIANEI